LFLPRIALGVQCKRRKKMKQSEIKEKTELLELQLLELDVEDRKSTIERDKRATEQEIVRRNIEVCVSVLKTVKDNTCNILADEAVTKISELMKQLS